MRISQHEVCAVDKLGHLSQDLCQVVYKFRGFAGLHANSQLKELVKVWD